MRIALISPFSRGPQRGNITTVNRISHFLRQTGIELMVLPADALSFSDMEQQLISFSPRLIHGFHACYGGCRARHLAETLDIPFIITITGSDLHDPQLRCNPEAARALKNAQTVVCFAGTEATELVGFFPHLSGRVAVIAQGVERLPVAADEHFGIPENDFVLLLPAALRPVKQIEFPLQAIATLIGRYPSIRLVIAGGIINHDYAATIGDLLTGSPSATWLGEVPRELMGALYSRADVVINCSRFESMPNTLMEAMALERPVLAIDIPGNRTLVRHGSTGLLYRDPDTFCEGTIKLKDDAGLREKLARQAGEAMRSSFSPHAEAENYVRLYDSLIS
jgi:glycosyltransferase involved in cell wall biosynthesis